MKNFLNTLAYYGIILLSVLAILIPGAAAYCLISGVIPYTWMRIIIGIIGVLFLILNKPLIKWRVKFRNLVEYDEFGRAKSKQSYDRLSKKERDKIDEQKIRDMERVLNTSALMKMTKEGSKDPWKDMERLIGLKEPKDRMKEMVARMEFEKSNKVNKNLSARHMIFTGAPGTGKTTVARIITGFLFKNGYIKKNKCVEVDGNFLKSGTASDTALKTELVIRHAFDGVLFIDEAYALCETGDGSGSAAIATLVKQMEDNRDRFILILAGYTNEMKDLHRQNPGFESRIKEYIDFPNYSMEELWDIFVLMAQENNLYVDISAADKFYERMEKEQKLRSFGNARTVRNLLDEVIDKHALNVKNGQLANDEKFKICAVDISPNIPNKMRS